MMRIWLMLAGAGALSISAAVNAQEGSPCRPLTTCSGAGPDAMRLETAWKSAATTGAQRDRIMQAIAAHRSGENTDYAGAAREYFAWRVQATGYDPGKVVVSEADSARIAADTRAHYRRMRLAAESAVRSRLIDPSSAEFSFLGGFIAGEWKPFLARRVSGNIACGTVNARNRMGGYVGATAFVVVLNNETPIFVDMDSNRPSLTLVAGGCLKASFPPPQPGMLDEPAGASTMASAGSVADELAKLAKLKEQGVLSESEFQEQKARLLR